MTIITNTPEQRIAKAIETLGLLARGEPSAEQMVSIQETADLLADLWAQYTGGTLKPTSSEPGDAELGHEAP
jgi:hypothetical protein